MLFNAPGIAMSEQPTQCRTVRNSTNLNRKKSVDRVGGHPHPNIQTRMAESSEGAAALQDVRKGVGTPLWGCGYPPLSELAMGAIKRACHVDFVDGVRAQCPLPVAVAGWSGTFRRALARSAWHTRCRQCTARFQTAPLVSPHGMSFLNRSASPVPAECDRHCQPSTASWECQQTLRAPKLSSKALSPQFGGKKKSSSEGPETSVC